MLAGLTLSGRPDNLADVLIDSVADPVATFFQACQMTLGLIRTAQVADTWDAEGAVDQFTVGGLVAHVYAAIRLLERSLDQPQDNYERVIGLADFYLLNRLDRPSDIHQEFHTAIREHAHTLAQQGPANLSSKFAAMVERLGPKLADQPLTLPVPVWRIQRGATSLRDYLLTRIIELAVHSDDLAASVAIGLVIPEQVASAAFAVCVDLARARCGDLEVLRAFTRRERSSQEILRVF